MKDLGQTEHLGNIACRGGCRKDLLVRAVCVWDDSGREWKKARRPPDIVFVAWARYFDLPETAFFKLRDDEDGEGSLAEAA
jgi:hypothetical protein